LGAGYALPDRHSCISKMADAEGRGADDRKGYYQRTRDSEGRFAAGDQPQQQGQYDRIRVK
jgi:hypothetical protein